MTRYAGGQILFAVAVVVVGTVKALRLVIDEIDDATSNLIGLT